MKRVFGIETEYGITVEGAPDLDVVKESIELVRSYTEHGAHMKWDYALEDPHVDARGFRADELLQDTDEAAYFELDRNRPLTFEEIKSDLVLSNGARFYNDHAHPEYSTPECATLRELVAADKAGERVLEECARRRNTHLPPGQRVRLYKNNTDFHGHSYGCHDNYLMRRDVPWDDVVTGLLPFLVTRQLYAGAGKVGIEDENHELRGAIYQLAQRSDFFSVLTSIDTMNRRPIVNTRDEPHADERLYRRLHIITGDANMSEWATAMKIGTTTLIIDLIERRAIPSVALDDPILAIRNISRDMSRRWLVTLENGRSISALDLQWIYLSAAKTLFETGSHSGNDEPDSDTIWVLAEWERVLNDLVRDPALCGDRCDWVAKYQLLNAFREAESLSWDAPWLQSLDLEYHNICRDEGLFYELHRENRFQRIVEERDVREAIFHPPTRTRAFARGRIVAKFDTAIRSISWNEIVFEPAAGEPPLAFRFDHASHHPAVDQLNEAVETVHTASDLAQAMHAARAGTSGGAEEASR